MQSLQFTYKRYSNRMPIPFHGFAILLLISLATLTTSCKEQENNSLLQFLSGLSNDAGLAKSWQEGTDCCRWEGITCNGSKTVIEVSLASRGLEGNISQSLENLTGLQLLNLSCNSLSGGLPLGLVSSRSVIVLDVSFNQLNGDLHELPSQIPGQPLQVLNISSNLFTGQFTSTTWKGMENLIALNASNNSFTGQLPSHFCSISPSLAVLELCYNKLSGSIPPGLGNCSKLRVLKAGHNNLSGTLPDDLFNATLLEYLSFSSNSLQGMFDGMDIVKLSNLAILDLGENKFGGNIPDSIGQLKRLQEFHLDYNSMFGELPSTLNNCTELITLDLKGNIFSGELNKKAYTHAETSLRYGYLRILRNSKKLTTLFLGANFKNENMPEDARLDGFETLQVLGRILVSIRVKRLTAKSGRGDNSDVEETSFNSRSEHELIMMPHGKTDRNTLTFSDIVKGTNNFDKEHIIGCGGYGLVYKAELPDGCKLAIKKLNGDMCLMEREFTAEVQALSMAKHDHLVPLWGYCSQGNSRFLIYSFMENGSLDDWLHNRDDDASTFLDWSMRLGIAQGASRGLSYIHNVCKPHIVHRDIKSSNILLDKELKAYVADFGLSRLILPNKTHVTTELVGTLGYIPPEYAHGWVATLRGDIYSFGVVLLELLTGLRPVPVLSTSKELVPWVLEMRSQGKQIEVLDPTLRGTGHEEQMLKEAMQPNHFSYKKCSSRLPIPSLGLVIVLLVSLASPTSSCTELDKASLLLFLGGLSQDAGLAKSWQEGTDCCKWEGVACNRNGTVTRVSLASRGLQGRISPSLGNLTSLEHLNLSYNMLSGGLPPGLVSSSSIIVLDVSFNQLTGDLHDLPSSTADQPLEVLNISSNMFTGKFTSRTWEGMTNLVAFNASNNSFTGELPGHFCNISPSFAVLELCCNKFSGRIPPGLGNCSKLRVLKAGHNRLSGSIPDELFNSTSLEQLSFPNNGLDGVLEGARIVNLIDLVALDLGRNKFTGNIPDSIGQLKRLEELHLENNNMSEELPSSLGNCTNLRTIGLKSNKFSGELRKILKSCPNLTTLLLGSNFRGELLPQDDTFNGFENIQPYRGNSNVIDEYANANFREDNSQFGPKGVIPPEIGQLKALVSLDISFNNLEGPIPNSICNLTNLQVLDLSNNNLTGAIPSALENLHFLSAFNISNNNLEGPIPTGGQFSTFHNSSFDGNPKLCSPLLGRRCSSADAPLVPTKGTDNEVIIAIAFGTFFAVISILVFLWRLLAAIKVKRLAAKSAAVANGDVETTLSNSSQEHTLVTMLGSKAEENKLTFPDIIKATNNFDTEHIIGCGGYGLVYKAELPDGCKLAIKKLNGEMCLMEREFTAEVEVLSMAQHDNLVPLWGYCVQGDSWFLIYSFMENGSLDDWLHNRDDDASTFLDWPTRLKIAQGASHGLSYIHNVCKPHIVHRDIKSSNILLDKDFKARVADFGLSRLILSSKTHVTTELVGTLGYIPPEYGQGFVATLRGDIYSFGFVLLELLTGLGPIPVLSTSKELVPWALEMRSQGRQIEVLDPTLRGIGHEEQMLKVLEVACKCVNYNPSLRPPIMQVVTFLESIHDGRQM
nr:unnamed protein product [Digitaria exilis]